jgi:hypothetical protein
MSEPEKIKEAPKPPQVQEKSKEPSAPKTSQSAFDKVLEQQKILQQSPLAQGKVAEQQSGEQRIKEITKWQDQSGDHKRKDDKDESGGQKERVKSKEKGSDTVTREAVVRQGEKRGSGQGSGGGGREGFGGTAGRRQIIDKKLSDARGLLNNLGQSPFASKLAQAKGAAQITPQQMQQLVNKIVQAIQVGRNELGWPELRLILKDAVFKGLRLRFTSRHGKVSIQFETADKKVKDLFSSASTKIKAALQEKGVAVEEIKIV